MGYRVNQAVCSGRAIDIQFLSAESWMFYVISVFDVVGLQKNLVFITQVRETRRIFRKVWKRLRYVNQMNEEQLSCWPWIISILASVNGTVVYRNAHYLNMIGSLSYKLV